MQLKNGIHHPFQIGIYLENEPRILDAERVELIYGGCSEEQQYRYRRFLYDRRYGSLQKRWAYLMLAELELLVEQPCDMQ